MARGKKTTDAAAAAPAKEKAVKATAKTTKEPAAKKTAARKAACKTSVCVEMSGLSVGITEIQNAVKKAIKEKGLEASELKIYINAAEQAAYYTVDGEGGEEFKVALNEL